MLTKIFGSKNQREIKKLSKVVDRINAFESDIQALSDEALKAKTIEFRERFETG